MQLKGSKSFPASHELTYELLMDTDVLRKAMPGLKPLKAPSDTVYEAVMKVGVAWIMGIHEDHLEMIDIESGKGYRLVVNGEGKMDFMEGDNYIDPKENELSGTDFSYEGEAKIVSKMAGAGQRVLSGVSRLLINQFFNGLLKVENHAT